MDGRQIDRKTISWLVAVSLVFVLPIIAVNLNVPVWIGRMIAVSSFTFFFTVAIFWFGVSPNTKMIVGKRGLADPKFDHVRPRIELAIRIAVVLFGFVFLASNTVPLANDLLHLATGEQPTTLTATITYRTSSPGGLLVGERSVRFDRRGESYYLFYSWTKPLRIGETYVFVVLPRSRMILDFHEGAAVRDQ